MYWLSILFRTASFLKQGHLNPEVNEKECENVTMRASREGRGSTQTLFFFFSFFFFFNFILFLNFT